MTRDNRDPWEVEESRRIRRNLAQEDATPDGRDWYVDVVRPGEGLVGRHGPYASRGEALDTAERWPARPGDEQYAHRSVATPPWTPGLAPAWAP